MFNLTSRRGVAAVLSVPALLLTQVSCTPASVDGTFDANDQDIADAEAAAQAAADAARSEAAEAADEIDAVVDELVAGVTGSDFGSCHESNTKGGNSDGVLVLETSGIDPGTKVDVVVTLQDGAIEESLSGTIDDSGRLVVVMPLNSFGEVITLVSVSVNGGALDLGELEGATFVVESQSEKCDLVGG